jgi:hypothetical protein
MVELVGAPSKGGGAHGGSTVLLGGGLAGAGHVCAVKGSTYLLHAIAATVRIQEWGEAVGGNPAMCKVARWREKGSHGGGNAGPMILP